MRKLFAGFVFSVAVLHGVSAWAQSPESQERAEELARQSLETLMRTLETMLNAVPQYALPEINENGDIIIRRIRPNEDRRRDRDPDDDDRVDL